MKALVVYESMFGNTERVAQAVADGLAESMDVERAEVNAMRGRPGPEVDLLVAGGPTHAFSMTRTNTRSDAINRGAWAGDWAFGLREWLQALPWDQHPQHIATFDTKVGMMRHLPGSAAKGAARLAHRRGFDSVVEIESFYVKDVAGPLLDGELERAREWGRHLAEIIGEVRETPAPAGSTT